MTETKLEKQICTTLEKQPKTAFSYTPFIVREGLENMNRCHEGGFHSVHLSDVLDGRFEVRPVVYKLGHSWFGIV